MSRIWPEGSLKSPVSGATLHRDGDTLVAEGEAWPVIDDIPFLRADRLDLAKTAVQTLRSGDTEAALVHLLGDQDGWARTPPPSEERRRYIARNVEAATFRDAMDALAFGPVATYFRHRWSDPTFLSGLALAEAHWNNPARSFELACGAGHFLREFARVVADVSGADLVFSKLWLARHYVAPSAKLVCFDAALPWPLDDRSADLVFCHDAFYFFNKKQHVASEMERIASDGNILVGHVHNAGADNLSAGVPLCPQDYRSLFDRAVFYDDNELTRALIEARSPHSSTPGDLDRAPALSMAIDAACDRSPQPVTGGLSMPPPTATLQLNPLYVDGLIVWPSERYSQEYGPLATYPMQVGPLLERDAMMNARRRVYLDLPTRW